MMLQKTPFLHRRAVVHRPFPALVLLLAFVAAQGLLGLLAPRAMAIPTAGPPEAQGEARREMRAGHVRSLRDIERQVLPMMGGAQYLGPEYDPLALVYRLKFIQNGRVVFVDVDARTGDVIGQRR